MGRDKIPFGKKKKPIRIWFENDTIENLGVERIKKETSEHINKLQSASLTKCSEEALKSN